MISLFLLKQLYNIRIFNGKVMGSSKIYVISSPSNFLIFAKAFQSNYIPITVK